RRDDDVLPEPGRESRHHCGGRSRRLFVSFEYSAILRPYASRSAAVQSLPAWRLSVLSVCGLHLLDDDRDRWSVDLRLAHERYCALNVVRVDRLEEGVDLPDGGELFQYDRTFEIGLVHGYRVTGSRDRSR